VFPVDEPNKDAVIRGASAPFASGTIFPSIAETTAAPLHPDTVYEGFPLHSEHPDAVGGKRSSVVGSALSTPDLTAATPPQAINFPGTIEWLHQQKAEVDASNAPKAARQSMVVRHRNQLESWVSDEQQHLDVEARELAARCSLF
jgi:hypothetical protein